MPLVDWEQITRGLIPTQVNGGGWVGGAGGRQTGPVPLLI